MESYKNALATYASELAEVPYKFFSDSFKFVQHQMEKSLTVLTSQQSMIPLLDILRYILLGDPGTGKTTAILQKMFKMISVDEHCTITAASFSRYGGTYDGVFGGGYGSSGCSGCGKIIHIRCNFYLSKLLF